MKLLVVLGSECLVNYGPDLVGVYSVFGDETNIPRPNIMDVER